MNILQKIYSKLIKKENGCLEWSGNRHEKGYGQFYLYGKNFRVHCLIWEFHNGPIPKDKEVCHNCDNPPCAEINHLYLATHAKNIKDAYDRKLINQPRGENRWNSILNEELVLKIRELHSLGFSDYEISQKFQNYRKNLMSIAKQFMMP